jgi:hypothetical protein
MPNSDQTLTHKPNDISVKTFHQSFTSLANFKWAAFVTELSIQLQIQVSADVIDMVCCCFLILVVAVVVVVAVACCLCCSYRLQDTHKN